MTGEPLGRAGHGPLTLGLVIGHAAGMFRVGYGRVAGVALLLYVPPAAITISLERAAEARPGIVPGLETLLAVGVAGVFRLFGPVVFAGYLDEAVGSEYFDGRPNKLRGVLRTLPWGRLLIADLFIVAGTTIGLALLVLPGLAFFVAFGLVGPVVVRERRGVRDALGRTYRISRTAVVPIVALVLVPLACEQVIHELSFRAVHDESLPLQVFLEWVVAAVVGGTVGLLEVALAAELMARNPEPAT